VIDRKQKIKMRQMFICMTFVAAVVAELNFINMHWIESIRLNMPERL
jgi:hypothetical protein